ncbi:hypothetical protein GCM10007079_35330 [Nocardiopsis terrae]|uniref:Amino acid adenylation domain-containing protein/non-ribosomal peptide synthase protein (TIGR01720 family) n=1 Tax=Nocardiopsis terrae TaxID=372655 RepID=A0ABR9HDQ5_9ACTN|nr:non-ribosomal peptide synthetase [Nocardiopsis terrae]MBE1456930.1 amino acid adenylation domain-containing protein/non-ribosomal peptide synthase protein (TIGR01720 family) [Nocardiopsis terrae]GHC89670.1 hypothetical protein GCM10007079_35330 [Nocardiopsis terrae]
MSVADTASRGDDTEEGPDSVRAVPLTEEQVGLLAHDGADPDLASYDVPLALDLRGDLDVDALERALALVMERHPLLNAYVVHSPRLELRLRPGNAPRMERRSGVGTDAVSLLAEAGGPIDLETGVSRTLLFQHAPDHHTLLLLVHHVVIDGESVAILLRDVIAAYEHGEVPGPPPADFADYVTAREAEAEAAGDDVRLREFWRDRLSDADVAVDLPLDTPGGSPTRWANVEVEIGPGTRERMRELSRTRRVGTAAILLGAYLRALSTYARQDVPAAGVPFGMRGDPRFEATVGYFVRTLLVRSPETEGTAGEYVTRVQRELARVVDHSSLPFPRVRELTRAAGAAGEEPFNCAFVLQNWADTSAAADQGVTVRGLRVHWRQDIHAPGLGTLTLELYESHTGVRGRLKYDAALITEPTAEAIAEHLVTLVEQIVDTPDRAVRDLDGIGPGARAVLDRLSETDRTVPDTDVDALLRERVSARPDATAVEFGDRSLTYGELDARVDAIASGLAAAGVEPGDRVGVLLPRSEDTVAALLGIVRGGAAYVPLDPDHPKDRGAHIVASSGMRFVLVTDATAAVCPDGPRPLHLDDLGWGEADPGGVPSPDAALHVLYTSGSTGVPKGVRLSHRALVTDILAAIRHFGVGPDDTVLLKAPLTFDVSAHEMLVALLSGACLVVAPPDAERDTDLLAETLQRHGVTLTHLVPAQLRLLVESGGLAGNTSLRAVVSTGETLPNDLRAAFEAVHPARLHNAYGPTETSYSTVFSWDRGDTSFWTRRADVPIGAPFDNVRCHVLDERRRPLPPGAPGELWISGGTVSDGYVGDPERTADRYVTLGLGRGPERCYATGDLVRLLPNGALAHLGRLDDQVKINGNRVELGEVRAALVGIDGVLDAAVHTVPHDHGGSRIVAHVVTDHPADTRALREAAGLALPAHMVPSRFVLVPSIPLLANGKTDRRALEEIARSVERDPPEEATRTAEEAPREPSRQPLPDGRRREEATGAPALPVLREIWDELLGEGSDEDQFYEVGGDSILAMQLVSRLRRAGYGIGARDIARHPVRSDLAAFLDAGPSPSEGAVAAPSPGEAPRREPGTELAPVQSWFFRHVRTDRHQWNQSVLLDLAGPVDTGHLRLALQAVVAAHPALSARFEPAGPDGFRMVPGRPFAAEPPREVLWEREVRDERELDRALEEAEASLDPFAGTHVRALLVRSHDGREQLLIAIHHLCVDGVSWRILVEDLESALGSLAEGALPALPPEARRFDEWIAEMPGIAAREGGAEYWRAIAAERSAAETLLLTTPAPDESDVRRVEFRLSPEATARLTGELPRRLGLTIHEVMTGAFSHALSRWRGARTVTFDVETHGRHGYDDLFRTVGWFTSIHPVVLTGDRSVAPEVYLSQVGPALRSVPDGGVGFGACRDFSTDASVRDALRSVAPALVCFNYYGQADQLGSTGVFRMSDRPIPREHSARCERVYAVEAYAIVHEGRLRAGLTWVPSLADGVDENAVHALVDRTREILGELAADPSDGPAKARPPSAPGREIVPVTPQQRGLLLDALAHQHSGRYVEQLHWAWNGPLDFERFARAWQVVVDRNAALRMAFDWSSDPVVVVADDVDVRVRRTALGAAEREDLLVEDRRLGFDLAEPGLIRVTVVDEGDDQHRVLLTFHHAVLDGWSVSLLIQEFYRAYARQGRLDGPAVPDARDYARWIERCDTAPARDFWRRAIPAGPLATAPGLPGDMTGESGYGRVERRVDAADAERLRSWAAASAATESGALHTAWALLLRRCASEPGSVRVSFGVTVSGRGIPLEGAEHIPGLLMNSLPLGLDVDPDTPVRELLTRAREAAFDMTSYEWTSTGQIHEWSGRPTGEPLVESIVVVENYPRTSRGLDQELRAAGVTVGLPEARGSETAFPVALLAHRDADGNLVLTLVHDRARLADTEAVRLADVLERLLCGLPAQDEGAVVGDVLDGVPEEWLPHVCVDRVPAGTLGSGAASADWPDGPGADAAVEVVRGLWMTFFDVDDVTPDAHFFAMGGHSLSAMRFLRELSDRTGRTPRLDDLLANPRAGQLAAFLAGPSGPDPDVGSVLVPLRSGRADAATVFLVHPPGGQVACYAQLAQCYDGPETIVGIRDPRVDDPRPEYLSTEELADRYLEALHPVLREGRRVVLGGFSGGGVVAYEMARRIARDGGVAPRVVMVDAGAPDGDLTDAEAEGSFVRRLRLLADGDEQTEAADGDSGSENVPEYLDELAQIAEWLRGAGGGDPVALMRETVEAVQRYRPPLYDGPVTVLRARDTDFGAGTEYDESDRYHARLGLGWEAHCSDLAIRVVPGNHVTMLVDENVAALARVLSTVVGD